MRWKTSDCFIDISLFREFVHKGEGRVCHPISRPEGATAISPGQRPVVPSEPMEYALKGQKHSHYQRFCPFRSYVLLFHLPQGVALG